MADVIDRESHQEVQAEGTGKNKIVGRIIAFLVVAGLAFAGYTVWQQLSKVESTDDAEIDGHIMAVSARVTGHVVEVPVEDEMYVKEGDVLAQLDKADFDVAVAKAKADLEESLASLQSTRTDVPVTSTTTSSTLSGAQSTQQDATIGVTMAQGQLAVARARLTTAQANVRAAEANYNKAAQDVERYKTLVAKDEISKQQYDQAVSVAEAARATLDAQKALVVEAEQAIAVSQTSVEQSRARVAQAQATVQSAMTGPQQVAMVEARVKSAAAKVDQQRAALDQAELNLKYTTITAPASGIIGKKNLDIGQNVSAGQQLMAIVPLENVWVTANFKETQLKEMRPGQKVKINVDATDREYTGKVERIGGASGAKFSLLPPENATGNYVKVVQRIPVRILFDPGQNDDHMLRPGMSVDPTVQVR